MERSIMLSKRIFYGFYLMLILIAGCGIFEPDLSTGTLNIIMKSSQANGQLNKQLGTQLSNAHCIIDRNNHVEYAKPLLKEGDCFQARIAELKRGGYYSVFLYGKERRAFNIIVSAHHAGIRIEEGKETTIELEWSPFVATLNTPALGDTVTGGYINLEWEPPVGAKGYRFIVADNPDFISPITDNEIYWYRASIYSGLLQEGTYYWKVQCIGMWVPQNPTYYYRTTDREGHWSEVSSFVYKKH